MTRASIGSWLVVFAAEVLIVAVAVLVMAVLLPLLAAILCDSDVLQPWTSVGGNLSSLSLLHSNGTLHSQNNLLSLKVKLKGSVHPNPKENPYFLTYT